MTADLYIILALNEGYRAWISPEGQTHPVGPLATHAKWSRDNLDKVADAVPTTARGDVDARHIAMRRAGWIQKHSAGSYCIGHIDHLPRVRAYVEKHHPKLVRETTVTVRGTGKRLDLQGNDTYLRVAPFFESNDQKGACSACGEDQTILRFGDHAGKIGRHEVSTSTGRTRVCPGSEQHPHEGEPVPTEFQFGMVAPRGKRTSDNSAWKEGKHAGTATRGFGAMMGRRQGSPMTHNGLVRSMSDGVYSTDHEAVGDGWLRWHEDAHLKHRVAQELQRAGNQRMTQQRLDRMHSKREINPNAPTPDGKSHHIEFEHIDPDAIENAFVHVLHHVPDGHPHVNVRAVDGLSHSARSAHPVVRGSGWHSKGNALRKIAEFHKQALDYDDSSLFDNYGVDEKKLEWTEGQQMDLPDKGRESDIFGRF